MGFRYGKGLNTKAPAARRGQANHTIRPGALSKNCQPSNMLALTMVAPVALEPYVENLREKAQSS